MILTNLKLYSSIRRISSVTMMMMTPKNTNQVLPKPTCKGIIFDMDGTLTKSNIDFKEMYDRCKVDYKDDILDVVNNEMDFFHSINANKVIEEMEEEGRNTLQLKQGAIEMGIWCTYHNIPISIVTRNTKKTVDTLTSKLWKNNDDSTETPLLNTFSPIVSRDYPLTIAKNNDDDKVQQQKPKPLPYKPNPEAAKYIADEWSIELPTLDLLMVGDSIENDIVFGKNAGISTVLMDDDKKEYNTNDNDTDEKKKQPTHTIEHLWQLPRIIWTNYNIENSALGTNQVLLKYSKPDIPTNCELTQAAINGDVSILDKYSRNELLLMTKNSNDNDDNTNTNDEENSDNGGKLNAGHNTLLIWASNAGQTEFVSKLLQKISDDEDNNNNSMVQNYINHRGYLGATAINRASRYGYNAVLELLLQYGGNPNIPNNKMQYPLHFAAFKKNPETVKVLLLSEKINMLVLDRKGRTPDQDTSDETIRQMILDARKNQNNLLKAK